MNSLSFFVCVPVLMMLALLLCKSRAAIRTVMVTGSLLLMIGAVILLFAYLQERATNLSPMLFTASTIWYQPLQIGYSVGVDAISVVMILLSSVIVLTGVLFRGIWSRLPKSTLCGICFWQQAFSVFLFRSISLPCFSFTNWLLSLCIC